MAISQSIINLYDAFTHGRMSRRDFMEQLTKQAGGAAAATALLASLSNNYAQAALVAEDDARLTVASSSFPGPDGDVKAYTASLKADGKRPAVIVIHENRGLNAHIQDVARRIALEGFIAIAPDLLSSMGGTPADEDKARGLLEKLDPAKTAAALVAAVAYAKSLPNGTGKVGAVGFCWGGGMANQLAVHAPDLAAAAVYYGPQPTAADVPKIKASLMLHYAGKDDWVGKGIAAYEAALTAAKVDFQAFVYPDANHAFNNDTNAARYDKAAAELAWGRTIGFLKAKLAG
jgi:carboxymethylenebutenolidase